MPLESSDFFRIARMAYKAGLTGKMNSISEQAVEDVLQELGIGPYEMFDYLDQADPDSVEKILERTPAFLVRLTARPMPMKLASLALDWSVIRNMVQGIVKGRTRQFFVAAMENTALPGEAPQ